MRLRIQREPDVGRRGKVSLIVDGEADRIRYTDSRVEAVFPCMRTQKVYRVFLSRHDLLALLDKMDSADSNHFYNEEL